MPMGPNILAESTTPLFYELANPADVGIAPPDSRMGDSLRTWVRSLSVFQKKRWSPRLALGVSGGSHPTKARTSMATMPRPARSRS